MRISIEEMMKILEAKDFNVDKLNLQFLKFHRMLNGKDLDAFDMSYVVALYILVMEQGNPVDFAMDCLLQLTKDCQAKALSKILEENRDVSVDVFTAACSVLCKKNYSDFVLFAILLLNGFSNEKYFLCYQNIQITILSFLFGFENASDAAKVRIIGDAFLKHFKPSLFKSAEVSQEARKKHAVSFRL